MAKKNLFRRDVEKIFQNESIREILLKSVCFDISNLLSLAPVEQDLAEFPPVVPPYENMWGEAIDPSAPIPRSTLLVGISRRTPKALHCWASTSGCGGGRRKCAARNQQARL